MIIISYCKYVSCSIVQESWWGLLCLQQPPPARGRWQRSSFWLEVDGDYFEKGQVEDQTRGGVGAESGWRFIWTLHRCSPLASLQFTKVQFRQQHHPIRIVNHCHQTSLDDNKKKPNQTFLKTVIRKLLQTGRIGSKWEALQKKEVNVVPKKNLKVYTKSVWSQKEPESTKSMWSQKEPEWSCLSISCACSYMSSPDL